MPDSLVAQSDWSIFDENSWLGVPGLLAVAVAGLTGRLFLQIGRIRFRGPPPSAFALAYLAGGAKRVTYAALAALRAYGCLSVTSDSAGKATLQVTAPPPHADPVELAVHRAIAQEVEALWLPSYTGLRTAMRLDVDRLHRDGLLLTRRRRRAARIMGIIGGIGAVLVGTIVAAVLGIPLLFVPVSERSFVAVAIVKARRRRRRLDANWRRLRPADARIMIALHGEAALVAGDPDLARALGLRTARAGEAGDGDMYGPDDSPGDGGGDD